MRVNETGTQKFIERCVRNTRKRVNGMECAAMRIQRAEGNEKKHISSASNVLVAWLGILFVVFFLFFIFSLTQNHLFGCIFPAVGSSLYGVSMFASRWCTYIWTQSINILCVHFFAPRYCCYCIFVSFGRIFVRCERRAPWIKIPMGWERARVLCMLV